MSETLQGLALDRLMRRPRGAKLVLGVAWRLVMAAALFLLCQSALSWYEAEARMPEGAFQVSHCEHQWYQAGGSDTCSGTLRTAPGGHVLTESATLSGLSAHQPAAGSTIVVRYDAQFDLDPDTSREPWLAARDGLIAVSFGVCGVMALVNVVRRIRPDLAWLRPQTKQWGRLAGTGTTIAVLSAVASLVCALAA